MNAYERLRTLTTGIPIIRTQPAKVFPSPASTITATFTHRDAITEDIVLARLARLTDQHGPWEAARRAFGDRS